MKAISINQAGGVDQFNYIEMDKPTPASGEVLIATKAISVNPVDFKVRMIKDVLDMICGEGYPAILGWDIAGEITAIGSEVTDFAVGDRVFGMVNFPGRGNAYAEYLTAPANQITLMPEGSSFEAAAATTLAALTALQVLKSRVSKGDKILIHAGSGGVGHYAIQIAKHLGAHVITTSSAKNKDFVIGLGADEHIDYRSQAFEDVVTDLDFILDSLGGDNVIKCVKAVKEGGAIISLPAPNFSEEALALAKSKNIDVSFLLVESNGEDMSILKDYLENGIITPHISSTFGFEEMGKAHEQLESGRTIGKVIVTL